METQANNGIIKEAPASIICMEGEFSDLSFPVYPDEQVIIGRDLTTANIILSNPDVSKKHCIIRYFEPHDAFFVTDVSTSGTYRKNGERLAKNRSIEVPAGTVISVCDGKNTFLLTSKKNNLGGE